MALKKSIRQDDGVVTSYHRILFIQQMLNHHNSIVVVSYVDKEAREGEVEAEMPPYRKSKTFETTYNEGMTPEIAYEYLKTLPEFEGAEDV